MSSDSEEYEFDSDKIAKLVDTCLDWVDLIEKGSAARHDGESAVNSCPKRKRSSAKECKTDRKSRPLMDLSRLTTPTQDLLPLFTSELQHPHLVGVKRLISCYHNGFNMVLADEQELDRQVQVIGMLAHLKFHGVTGPFLIVGSPTVLPSWQTQLHRLLPGSPVLIYNSTPSGSHHALAQLSPPEGSNPALWMPPVLLISFEAFVSERDQLVKRGFKYIVVDASGSNADLSESMLTGLVGSMGFKGDSESAAGPFEGRVVVLSGTNPSEDEEKVDVVWPLLQLCCPKLYGHLVKMGVQELTNELDYSDLVHVSIMFSSLKDLLERFVLRRSAEEMDVSGPRQAIQVNLYDYFSRDE